MFGQLRCASLVAGITALVAAAPSATMRAGEASDELTRVQEFVEANLVGRTLEAITLTRITGSQMETEFHRRRRFLNPVRTPDAFSFDAVILIKQSNFDLDSSGRRQDKSPNIRDRVLVLRYCVRKLKSTPTLVGTSSCVTHSSVDPVGLGSSIRVSLSDDRFVMIESTPLYTDNFAENGQYKPGADEFTTVFWTENGKLTTSVREMGYDVDIKTLERVPSGHDVKMEEREVDGLW